MAPENHEFDSELLAAHLGELEPAAAAAVRQRVASDPALAEQDRVLSAALSALRSATVPPTPAGLADRALKRIASAPRLKPVWSEQQEEYGGFLLHTRQLRDIIAVAAVVVLAVGLAIPSLVQVRDRNERILCAANLAQVGRGLAAYANANQDSLPFAGWSRESSWQPTDQPGVQTRTNRSHVYRLVMTRHLPPMTFVCPASGSDVPMSPDQVSGRDDFPESRNISYAYQNMAGARPSLHDFPSMPILGDDNPFFQDGRCLLDLRNFSLGDPAQANSVAHRRAGQNILTLDGSARWETTPNVGILSDNIWTLRGPVQYSGREGPATPDDSHLIK